MPGQPVRMKKLRKILRSFDCWEDQSRGKGSHTMFFREIGEGTFSYPIPTHSKDVLPCYVAGVRRKFNLTEADGITDEDFFSRG